MKYFVYIFILTILAFLNYSNAQEDVRAPFLLRELSITETPALKGQAQIFLLADFIGEGQVAIRLSVDDSMKLESNNYTTSFEPMQRNEMMARNWLIKIPKDGYYFVMVNLAFIPVDSDTINNQFVNYHAYPLYFEIHSGKVTQYSTTPLSIYDNMPLQISKVPNELKPSATFHQLPAEIRTQTQLPRMDPESYTIYVYIYGKVFYAQAADFGSGFSPVNKGYPGIRVRLDWDYDNDPATGYTPYSSSARHIDYDDVDMNGSYYFSFSFISSVPAYQIAPHIRVYGNANPDGVRDGDRGLGAQFVPLTGTELLSLANITTNVVGQVNPQTDPYTGGASRHIHRSKLFSDNKLGFIPNTIRYYIRLNANTSFFCQNSNGNACDEPGVSTSLPFILFNRIPESNLGYHEYGHWIEFNKVGYQHTDGGNHYFELQTTQHTAWTEGFAEFYNAACHAYWYSQELPTNLEHLTRSTGDGRYELIDATQANISGTMYDNRLVEGAVACFMYSLWDEVERRAPNYTGDNDDVTLTGSYLLDRIQYNYQSWIPGSTRIEKFYNWLLLSLSSSEVKQSVIALYNHLILQTGIPRSATYTFVDVSGTWLSRTITWGDNTCLGSLTYQREGSTQNFTYNPVQNQESGFRLYHKQANGVWDGTLNGYDMIGIVGQDITTFNDNRQLTGNHSFVVVAYNASGNSIPKAQVTVNYPIVNPIISHFTQNPNTLCRGSWGRVNSYLTQGNGTLTYTWEPTPANLQIDPHGSYCNVFIPNTSALMGPDGDAYSLKCTVSNSAGSDWKIHNITSTNCTGCPTLAFDVEGEMTDDNPLLIKSLSNPGVDVTDYYLLQNPITAIDNQINLRIHEPQTEHTWLDYAELIVTRVRRDELVAVNDDGEIINYKESTAPVTVLLNGETNITEILASMDSVDIALTQGDVLTVIRNSQSPEDDGDGDIVLGGTDPIKNHESISLRVTKQNGSDESIENNNGDDPPIGGLFFRPKRSVIAKNLRNVPPGNLEIEINRDLVLDYLAIVRNIRTARTRTLNLLGAVHNQQGDVKNLLSSIDQNYAEILPGETIDFNFQFDNVPTERIAYIIKTVGRYETDTTYAFNKLTSAAEEDLIPKENNLFDNYPNPFNPTTQIKYSVKENGLVTLKVYDVLGKEVAGLVNEEKPAGEYTVTFDAENLSSGIYFYTLAAKEFQQTKKMILVK